MSQTLLGMPKSRDFGMKTPHLIDRESNHRKAMLRPTFCVPTLTHIEITYARDESCIMCYNPTRTKVNPRDKALVSEIVTRVAEQRIPHPYLDWWRADRWIFQIGAVRPGRYSS